MILAAWKCAIFCCIINLVIAQTILQPEISSLRKVPVWIMLSSMRHFHLFLVVFLVHWIFSPSQPEEELKDSLRKYPGTLLARNLTPEQIEEVRTRIVGLHPSKWPQVLSWFQPPQVKKCSFQVVSCKSTFFLLFLLSWLMFFCLLRFSCPEQNN